MSKKKKASKTSTPDGVKLIATNPNAKSNYLIEDTIEAGMVLVGTEVKSLRTQSPNLRDSYVEVRSRGSSLEAFLLNTHIAPYSHGNIWNHEPMRARKLLLHRREISRLFGATTKKGMTVVPLKMYFKKGLAKMLIGLGKGKKHHDKRDVQKKRSADREMRQAVRRGR